MSALPQGWRRAALGDVCQVVSGGTPKTGVAAFWDGDIPWVTPKDLAVDKRQVVQRGARSITREGLAKSSAKLFPAGSVIVSTRAPIGYVAIAGEQMSTNQGCKIAVPPAEIDSRYLYWYLLNAKGDMEARASGTTFKEISGKEFARTLLLWPALDEQQRIVEILEDHLSRLDAAAVQVGAVQRRLETWKRLALDQLVHEQASGTIKLADLVEQIEAGRSFGGSAPPARPDEWGIIKVSAMTWGSFKADENKAVPGDRVDPRYEIQPGDVLVSRANTTEYVGAPVFVASTRPRLLLSDKSLRIVPRLGTDRAWLATVLGARSTRRQVSRLATGTKDSMRNISQSSLLSVDVPAADAQQQREVVARAAVIEDRAARLNAELSNALIRGRALRGSLLAAAFTGQLTP